MKINGTEKKELCAIIMRNVGDRRFRVEQAGFLYKSSPS